MEKKVDEKWKKDFCLQETKKVESTKVEPRGKIKANSSEVRAGGEGREKVPYLPPKIFFQKWIG